MDKSNLTYQGEHVCPAASCSLLSNCASPCRAHAPHACGGSGSRWSVVKVRRTRERKAARCPTGLTARELLLGRTDERRAPGQHAHFVGGRRGCCWSWNGRCKRDCHSKTSLKQIFFFLLQSNDDFPLWSGEAQASCSAAGNRLSSPALQRQSGQACPPPPPRWPPSPSSAPRARHSPHRSMERCQRSAVRMAAPGWCHVP